MRLLGGARSSAGQLAAVGRGAAVVGHECVVVVMALLLWVIVVLLWVTMLQQGGSC